VRGMPCQVTVPSEYRPWVGARAIGVELCPLCDELLSSGEPRFREHLEFRVLLCA
jgi:hypothetical protein